MPVVFISAHRTVDEWCISSQNPTSVQLFVGNIPAIMAEKNSANYLPTK
jgi:hypothetical protein